MVGTMSKRDVVRMKAARAWSPRPAIRPVTSRDGDDLVVTSNGSPGCYGGWELVYPVVKAGAWLRFRVRARWQDLERGYDSVNVAAAWTDGQGEIVGWEPIFPKGLHRGHVVYEGRIKAAPGATALVVKLLMAWSARGQLRWREPSLRTASAPAPRRARLGAAAGPLPPGRRTLRKNTEFYLQLCREAAQANIDLLCLPEIMLTWGMPITNENLLRKAFPLPGEEIAPFMTFAREHGMALCFSALERNRELVHNTAVLIDKYGELVGKYRKVHLAQPLEVWWGVTPGHAFPVHDLDWARVGMNVCMDSSAAESARTPARQGAEIICLPIMGDHRASTAFEGRRHDFDVERWTLIQRMRAMDNHVYMVVSCNSGYGTGIFSPRGEVLAMSGGEVRVVYADIDLEDQPRMWLGATFKNVCWYERREPAYGPLAGDFLPDPFTEVCGHVSS